MTDFILVSHCSLNCSLSVLHCVMVSFSISCALFSMCVLIKDSFLFTDFSRSDTDFSLLDTSFSRLSKLLTYSSFAFNLVSSSDIRSSQTWTAVAFSLSSFLSFSFSSFSCDRSSSLSLCFFSSSLLFFDVFKFSNLLFCCSNVVIRWFN